MSKVFLGVGHGGSDPGAVGYVREEDLNLNMALACRDYLVARGVEVQMSRTKDENDDLKEEIKECNAYNPDLAVDIHNNAGGGDGFEAYYSVTGEGKTLAQKLETEVKAIDQNSRGCKTKWNSKGNADYYGFIRETKCKAVIVEGVFVDNKADAAQADTLEEQKAFGVAYAKGILKELGISDEVKPVEQPTQQPTEQPKPTLAHKVGETVKINGVYTSSTSETRYNPAYTTGTITKIVEGARNPYLLNNGGLGWVNDDCIVTTTTAKPSVEYYPVPNYNGSSIVDALNSIGVDSSYDNRKKIAQKNNVRDYKGTATQNNQMLAKLKAGRLIKA